MTGPHAGADPPPASGAARPPAIRVLAVAVCRDGDRVLVERGHDPVGDRHFYRAIGGGVEFGERAADAVVRERREELALELTTVSLVGVLESLFTHEGRAGHEVVFVHTARLADTAAYARPEIATTDGDGLAHVAAWVPLDGLRQGDVPLYPAGLLELLDAAR